MIFYVFFFFRVMMVGQMPWWCTQWLQPKVGQLPQLSSTGSKQNTGYGITNLPNVSIKNHFSDYIGNYHAEPFKFTLFCHKCLYFLLLSKYRYFCKLLLTNYGTWVLLVSEKIKQFSQGSFLQTILSYVMVHLQRRFIKV